MLSLSMPYHHYEILHDLEAIYDSRRHH